MKIEMAESTGCPVPQFVVHPETDEEQMLLRAFFYVHNNDPKWRFQMHGPTYQDGKIIAFNFGLVKAR
jgi:hypothetical protein